MNGLWKQRDRDKAISIDRELAKSYSVINSRLDINLFQSKIFISGEVMNLTNEQYADVLGAKMPDRWIIGSLRFKNNFSF